MLDKKKKKLLVEIIGWYGALAILVAYLLVSFDIIAGESLLFQLLNISGAMGLIILSLYKKVYQNVFLNTIWILIGLLALINILF